MARCVCVCCARHVKLNNKHSQTAGKAIQVVGRFAFLAKSKTLPRFTTNLANLTTEGTRLPHAPAPPKHAQSSPSLR